MRRKRTTLNLDQGELYRTFGDAVRFTRRAYNVSQVELGEAVGLSKASISGIEKGSQSVLFSDAIAICRALQIDTTLLLKHIPTPALSGWLQKRKKC